MEREYILIAKINEFKVILYGQIILKQNKNMEKRNKL